METSSGLRLTVIGGGNMGAAFARAAVARKLVLPDNLLIVERDGGRGARLGAELGCRVEQDFGAAIGDADIVLLAIKPQDLPACAQSLRGCLRAEQTVLSVLAGITIEALRNAFGGHARVVRCMPNTPAQAGMGMSVFAAGEAVPAEAVGLVVELLDAVGKSLRVEDEGLLDSATAISGSGPAYVFYFIEQYVRAARELGFSEAQAQTLVGQTIAGALKLWQDGPENAEQLRARVTSKGGTTEAGISELQKREFGEALNSATKAAHRRCQELLSAHAKGNS